MEIKNLFLGYFDAGDHLKFTFPMAFSMTMLSWSMLHYWEAYEAIGELDNAVEQIKIDVIKSAKSQNIPFL